MSFASLAPGTSEIVGDTAYVRLAYRPREYFKPYHNREQRFACIVAHRRAGKTVACIHDLQRRALLNQHDRSLYSYIAPTYSQAKSTAWDYLKDAASPYFAYGAKPNESELKVTYPNGAVIRLFGADNYDALRGLRQDGSVLDEYADIDPRAWTQVIRPSLSDRRGFATFIGTPRGHNHFFERYRDAVKGPAEWFSASLKASELVPLYGDKMPPDVAEAEGWLTSVELEQARRQMSDDWYRQEYECDFEASIKGAYYGDQMAAAASEGRITKVPYDPSKQVITAWDIGGNRDATAIWFVQIVGRQICVIDYYEAVGADSGPHARYVLDRGYSYLQHFIPHDAGPDRIGIDKNYRDFLEGHGLRNITVLPVGIIEHGINAVRLLLPRCVFDESKCERGIEALRMYRTEYIEKDDIFKSTPKHDWASHGADAFRYLAVALDKHVSSTSFNRKINYPKGFY